MSYIKTEWVNEPPRQTAVNATNMNKIENGIYNSYPTILYHNDEGNTGTIELSDSADNYTMLEILIWDFYVIKVYGRNNRPIGLSKIGGYGGNILEIDSESISISGKTIIRNANTHAIFREDGSQQFIYDTHLPIRTVIGYKY